MSSTPPQLLAKGTIRLSRFVVVDPANDNAGLESGANGKVIGIASEADENAPIPSTTQGNAATTGRPFRLYGDGDIAQLEAGLAIVRGDRLKSDSVGRGTPFTASAAGTAQYSGAIALESASAAGEFIRVQVSISKSTGDT